MTALITTIKEMTARSTIPAVKQLEGRASAAAARR